MAKRKKLKTFKIIKIINDWVLAILTAILIIVTISSIIATNRITQVSLYLDNLRQKESLISNIENLEKLDIELQANKLKAEIILKELPTYKGSTLVPNVKFSTTRLDTLGNIIGDLDPELIGEMELVRDLLVILNNNIENTWQHKDNMQLKEDSVNRFEQNLNALLNIEGDYSIQKLTFDLHGKKLDFKRKLEELNNKLENTKLS